jgi:plastocyanin
LSHRTTAALAAGIAVLVVVPASASAATKTVDMGTPLSSQKAFQKAFADANDFFPHGTTIHVGDSIKFVPTGFHTVDIPAKGKKPLPLILPAGSTSGVNDAAGAPFWFNGQPTLGFNPQLGPPGLYGKKVTYTGSKRIQSGLPLSQKPKPFTVKFTKTGSYTYYCNIHAGMKGTVKVVSTSQAIPSAQADSKKVKTQVSSALSTANALTKTKVAAGNVSVGASGPRGVESFAMYPATQTVPVGTTIKFSMSARTYEDHTATFGPGNPETEPTSYLGDLAKHFAEDPVFPSQGIYPSDPPPAGPAALTPTLHGNGFWNSGVLDVDKATPLPPSNSVTFAAPGTYNFYCMIHPFMHGTVVVQ